MLSDAAEDRVDDAADEVAAVDAAAVVRAGIDAAALKPTECDVARAGELPLDTVTVDYEGRANVPDADLLASLAAEKAVRVTTPVRADGYDPLGDDALARELPAGVGRVVVAGHPAYLSDEERGRAVAPRFGAATEGDGDAWVGTENVERLALATGGTQYELLARGTGRGVRAIRAAGFAGDVAVYAPTVLTDDDDEILDAVGEYVARRKPVREALSGATDGDAADLAVDARATGRVREILLAAADDYALTGTVDGVRERVAELRTVGVDTVVGYPARGIEEFL